MPVRTATTSTPRAGSGPSSAAMSSSSSSAVSRSVPLTGGSPSAGEGYQVSKTVPSAAMVATPMPYAPVVSGSIAVMSSNATGSVRAGRRAHELLGPAALLDHVRIRPTSARPALDDLSYLNANNSVCSVQVECEFLGKKFTSATLVMEGG